MKAELVTALKPQASKSLAESHDLNEPILITEHDQLTGCLIDVGDYE
jgi:PHD/YefM family antitoxin component YafN of YafNO toxin-antitoxin module